MIKCFSIDVYSYVSNQSAEILLFSHLFKEYNFLLGNNYLYNNLTLNQQTDNDRS